MEREIAWILLFVMLLSIFAGCKKNNNAGTTSDIPDIHDAIVYLQNLYKDDDTETPSDYERVGVISIADISFRVAWTVDIIDEMIKVVSNDDGITIIDVCRRGETDTPYMLTATITGENGDMISYHWNYTLPAAMDMVSIVNAAYALEPGENFPYETTLTGKVISIDTPYDDASNCITLTIVVEGAEDMPIICDCLVGDGVAKVKIGDTVTVTGILKKHDSVILFDIGCILNSLVGSNIKGSNNSVENNNENKNSDQDPKPGLIQETQPQDEVEDYEVEDYEEEQTIPQEITLTGSIISVDKPYDSINDNITVTISVIDQESRHVVCCDLKGNGVDEIDVDDLVTVKGYIESIVDTNGYNVEKLASGCQLLKWEDRTINEISVPTDPVEILEAAYNLDANASLAYESTLTGVISKVNTAYDSVYDNITIILTVAGCEDKPIVCYRMKGDGVSEIDIGDTITVKGYITNYINESGISTIQFDSPTLISYKKNVSCKPTDPVDIVNAAYALEPGTQLPYKVTLSGEILEVDDAFSADFNNITVTIQVSGVKDKPIKCYRMIGTDVDKISVGDTITVNGYIEKFQHVSGLTEVEFVFGCVMTQWSNTGADISETQPSAADEENETTPSGVNDESATTNPPTIDEENPTDPVIDEDIPAETSPTVSAEYVKGVAAGTKYYMGFNNGSRMYFDGNVASSGITCRLSATENLADVAQVMVESVSGGYLLYFMNGQTKTYIRVYERLAAETGKGKGGVELVTTAPAEVLVFDSTINTLVYKADDNNSYYLGTYDTYTTISVSNIASVTGENAFMLDVDQYPVRFYTS